ncbi:MAG: sulfite exporter TauE/SafE family protein [Candidatus Asgardarchaeia archaeon]
MDSIVALLYIVLGLVVGILIGLTGMGGGAIMTPILIFLGVDPVVAVGTDLLYSTITKLFGSALFYSRHEINMRLAMLLYLGSLPAIVLGGLALHFLKSNGISIDFFVSIALGVVLIVVSLITILGNHLYRKHAERKITFLKTLIIGFIVGFTVQFTSVGSGTLVVFFLLVFTNLSPHNIVGTTMPYSFLLTSSSTLVHSTLGTINFILASLLILGTLPGTFIGFKLNSKVPRKPLKTLLSLIVLLSGLFILLSSFS